MAVDFKNSETKKNLMRAFAGESQARNRYTFAASSRPEKPSSRRSLSFSFLRRSRRRSTQRFFTII